MKKTTKRFLAFMMTLCMVIGVCMPGAKAATSTARYDGGYGIADILSQFQFFVKGDVTLNNSGHTVGAVVVGGTLDLSNSFGDAGTVPSYISNLKNGNLGSGWHGDVPIKSDVVYYGTNTGGQTIGSNWYENPDYMDVDAAFDEIMAESKALSAMTSAETITPSNGSIVIDISQAEDDKAFNISYEDFVSANNINIKVSDINWFNKHSLVVSITGGEGNDFSFDGYSKVNINGTSISTAIETMNGQDKEYGKQLNFSGMNLVWNFPDASGTISVQGLGGHMVAPNAIVNLNGGDYEGGIIAKELKGGAEGHFYPMNRSLPGGEADTSVTAKAVFSKKAVSADGNELAGASMKLTYLGTTDDLRHVTHKKGPVITIENNNKIITWVSTTVPLELSGLPSGEYVLEETGAPDGYKYAKAIEFKVSDGKIYQKLANGTFSNTETLKLTMVDEVKKGQIKLTGTKKVEGDGVPSDEEYKFIVKEGTKQVATGKVTGAGEIEFTTIEYSGAGALGRHTYTITEVAGDSANISYDKSKIKVVVFVSDDKTNDSLKAEVVAGESSKIEFVNKYVQPGGLVVVVHDEKTGEEIPGAKVEITDPDGNTKEYTTDDDGKITIPETKPGDYTVKTTDVPDEYDVTIGKEETTTVEPGETTTHDVYLVKDAEDGTGDGSTGDGTTGGGDSSEGDKTTENGTTDGGSSDGGNTGGTSDGGNNTGSNNTESNTAGGNGDGSNATGSNNTGGNNTGSNDSGVRTGDDFILAIPIMLLIVSALGIIIISYRRRKIK